MITERRNCGPDLRFSELDSVRALAALWVFAYHVWQFGGSPELQIQLGRLSIDCFALVKHGPAGVDMFMVLSGFCLFWPLTNSSYSFLWRDYAIKRARRILPAYYGAIAFTILLPLVLVPLVRLAGWQANFQPIPSLRQILSHLLLIHTLFPDTWNGITGAFWSMGLEAQFYVVFPFLVFGWKKFGFRAIAYAALASLVFRICLSLFLSDSGSIESFLLSITFLGRWMQFAAGMASALWVRSRLERPAGTVLRIHWTVLVGAGLMLELAGLVAPALVTEGAIPLRDLFLSTGAAALLAGMCTTPSRFKVPLLRGALPYIGRISYSFFLIHQPTAWYAMEFFRKKLGFSREIQVFMGYTVGLLICTLSASMFHRFFEKPFLNKIAEPKGRTVIPSPQTESIA